MVLQGILGAVCISIFSVFALVSMPETKIFFQRTEITEAVTEESTYIYEEQNTVTEVTTEETSSVPKSSGKIVVIDPGHQRVGNSEQEPIGPGATETKNKVTYGTEGVKSGIAEYELNLSVSLKLKDKLENMGYTVILTRENNDVDISNMERAEIANNVNADAFVRIHADDSENSEVKGAMTICQTPSNPYNGELHKESYALSEAVLNNIVSATGAEKRNVWQTDTMSGINWAKVPCTIVEMGFMSNHEEDMLLATEDYQYKMAEGIAKGIDEYLRNKE